MSTTRLYKQLLHTLGAETHDEAMGLIGNLHGRAIQEAQLRALCAMAYAGLVAAYDLPEAWADAFLAASEGKAFNADGLLSVDPPKRPRATKGQLVSMALRKHHGFALLSPQAQRALLIDMKQVAEELTGHGFYTPDAEEKYAAGWPEDLSHE